MERICFVVPHVSNKVSATKSVSNRMKGSYKNYSVSSNLTMIKYAKFSFIKDT